MFFISPVLISYSFLLLLFFSFFPYSQFKANINGIAYLLALSSYPRKHSFWSKDLIFIATTHSPWGAQAFLDGYFGPSYASSTGNFLNTEKKAFLFNAFHLITKAQNITIKQNL